MEIRILLFCMAGLAYVPLSESSTLYWSISYNGQVQIIRSCNMSVNLLILFLFISSPPFTASHKLRYIIITAVSANFDFILIKISKATSAIYQLVPLLKFLKIQ